MWYRVFARSTEPTDPERILDHLHARRLAATGQFRGDDLGWTGGELKSGSGAPIRLECYRTREDELRDDLNTWAGWIETQDHDPAHQDLMVRVIQTQQLVTLRRPSDWADDALLDRICEAVCQCLAAEADGVYQVDGQGFHAPDGTLILREY